MLWIALVCLTTALAALLGIGVVLRIRQLHQRVEALAQEIADHLEGTDTLIGEYCIRLMILEQWHRVSGVHTR